MATHRVSFVPTNHHSAYAAISETNPALSCQDKVVFITGGGRGIGKAIAKSFVAAEAEGIFLVGRDKASLAQTAKDLTGGSKTKVLYASADIVDAQAVSTAFEQAMAAFGRIDILVQNAGYLDDHCTVADSDLQDYWRVFEVNIKGSLNVIRAFLHTKPAAGATIINVSSGAGHIPYIPGYSAYSASKLGFAKVVEYVQRENLHLRVFNINPGAIETDMQHKAGDIAAIDDIGKSL